MQTEQLIKNKQQFKPFIIGSILIARHQHVKIRYMGNTSKAYSHFNPFQVLIYQFRLLTKPPTTTLTAGENTHLLWLTNGYWQVTH